MITIRESGERFAKEYIMKGVSRRAIQELFLPNEFREASKEHAFCAQEGGGCLLSVDNTNIIEEMIVSSLCKFRKNKNKAIEVYREYIWYISTVDDVPIRIDWDNVNKRVFGIMASEDRFLNQMRFALEVDKLKNIGRQTYVSTGTRKENDAEHSWHLALMAYLLKEYSNEEIDITKVMLMVLIHDIVEIDAGDTYAYDEEANKTKADRERAAADRLFGMLPEDQDKLFKSLWEEFEANLSPEAKFANSLDKIQPMLLNDATGGKSWVEHGAKYEKVHNRFLSAKRGSEKIWEFGQRIIEKGKKNGKLS